MTTTEHDFAKARRVLAKYLQPTRLVRSQSLSEAHKQEVFLKLENELPTGSFKVRGAIYALSANEARLATREVVASSTGNHGAAVAYAAQLLGWRARIFLPEKCNPVKRQNIERLGAAIEETGAIDLAAAFLAASEYALSTGAFFLNDATDPDLPAGPGTIALEILERQPDLDAIYVPMGDTALVRGVAAAAKNASSRVVIVGVQSERAPSYYLSWKAGRAIETENCDTIADGLATRTPVETNVQAIRKLVNEVVLVGEDEMLLSIGRLFKEEQIVAEPAGAAATAAYLKSGGKFGPRVALLVSGGNISPEVAERAGIGGQTTKP